MQPIKLDYVKPDTQRSDQERRRERLMDLIDLLGGPRGLLLIVGIMAVLLGPHQRNCIGASSMAVGGVIIETVLVLWLKK